MIDDDQAPPPDDAPDERPPASDVLAEQSVLGAMLQSREARLDVMEQVYPQDFYLPKHEIIAAVIGEMVQTSKPIDTLLVVAELEEHGLLTRAGGATYVHELWAAPTTTHNAGHLATRIARLAQRRRIRQAGLRITQMGEALEGDVDTILENARAQLDTVSSGSRRPLRAIYETIPAYVDALDEDPRYLPTPYHSLDEVIGGFEPGGLYIIGARPGSGKSIAALQCAATLAHKGVVAFASLEMPQEQLQGRLLAAYGNIHMESLRSRRLAESDWDHLKEATKSIEGAPIFVEDFAGDRPQTLAEIRAHARAVARRGTLTGVIVDYIQLVAQSPDDKRDRRVFLEDVAQQLKRLAKDLDVPVIAAAQLKRGGQQRGRKRVLPTMDDLREAGLENAPDVVLLLDRDPDDKRGEISVVVAKNRQGEQAVFRLRWKARFARLDDIPWSPTIDIPEEEPGR